MTATLIRDLFSGQIDRPIEEVIKVDQDDVAIVRQEIDEYILTESIERNILQVLEGYRQAPNQPSSNIAVWVAGFFGAGKSSFAKYLGLAISHRDLNGESAGDLLAQRANDQKIKALLGAIREQIPTDVVLIDVSADRVVNTRQLLTEIFYVKLLDHLGYARNLLVAELELELEEEGRMENFMSAFSELYPNKIWSRTKTLTAQALSQASAVMHILEPETYPSKTSWGDFARHAHVPITAALFAERAIKLMKSKRNGRTLLFVVDEVGQYVSRDIQKMLDLQAIVQQLGIKGQGKAWLMVTSQENLSDVVGALDDNRPELARLQDRFPYKPTLEPSDIAEVTNRRLLGKSSTGETTLNALFQQHQGRLATHTKLDTKIRLPELNAKAFAELYPLLPYQIDLIISVVSGLRLTGGASKQFGGANRAIIKLAQELLTNRQSGLADMELGALVTLDRVYDLQSNNIDSQYRGKISEIGHKATHPLSVPVAKAICLLQFVDQVPVTEQNIAVVLHPRVDADSLLSEVNAACQHLVERTLIRKGADGQYRIPKPEEEDWEQVRNQQVANAQERNGLLQEALKLIWDPQPSAVLGRGVKTFKAALHFRGTELIRGEVPVKIELIDASEESEVRIEALRMRSQQERNSFFWAMPSNQELERNLGEWFRSQKVIDLKGRDATSKGQLQLVSEERRKLEDFKAAALTALQQALTQGTILLNGGPRHRSTNPTSALKAIGEVLNDGLVEIYERFDEAPVNPTADELTRLLNADSLKGLSGSIDTLQMCKEEGGQWLIDTARPALSAVLNRIRSKGKQTGNELISHFADPPFGWTLDCVKFLAAALQKASQLKATHSSQSYVGCGDPKARPLFTSNTTFKSTLFNLFVPTIGPQDVIEASQAFTDFAGKMVAGVAPGPLAREIRSQALSLSGVINGVIRDMTPLQLPGREELGAAVEQLSTWQDSDDEAVVIAFKGSVAAVKEERERARGIAAALESRKADLERARVALGPNLWGLLETEADLPEELLKAKEDLDDRLQSPRFYDKLPEIDQLTSRLEQAYAQRRQQAQSAVELKVSEGIQELEAAPGFQELDAERQDQLRAPLIQKQEAAADFDLVRLRDQPQVLAGLLRQQEKRAQEWAFPEAEVTTVSVKAIRREPIETPEQLKEVLESIEELCLQELGNDRKVLLQ